MNKLLMVAALLFFGFQSCYYDNEEELYPQSAGCDTANVTYGAVVSKITAQRCAIPGCHTGPSAQTIGNFTDHAGIKQYLDANKSRFIGAINHEPGIPQMPKNSAKLTPCELQKIGIWVNAGYPNN